MQPFGPNPTAMFPSWRRGAEASTPPVQDAFREVFQNRLLARLNSRNSVPVATDRSLARQGSAGHTDSRGKLRSGSSTARYQSRKEDTAPAASSSGNSGQVSAAPGRKLPAELPKTHQKPESQTPVTGLAAEQHQATSPAPSNQSGAAAANPPQALRNLIAFLQSLPGGALKIPPEQVPEMATFLKSAGLPQEEVSRLLATADSQEISLTAADLQAAWQRAQGQGLAGDTAPGQSPPSPTVANSLQAAVNPAQEAKTQDIRQTQDYRALWQSLTLPESMVPTLRLALSRLGASPELLAQLGDQGTGQGIPLTKVWEVLQNLKGNLTQNSASGAGGAAAPQTAPSQSDVLGPQPVSVAEKEEWRQLLLQAGLPPEVVEKLMGRTSPGTQDELKSTLLALAPPEQPPAAADPKPLYLPHDLQMRPFFWQSQNGGDQPQLEGNGGEDKGRSAAPQLAALPQSTSSGETLGLPSFAAELQGLTLTSTGTAAPLSSTGSTWQLLSPEVQESLWTQLQSGVVSNLGQGENQVTINLNPPDLGQIQLSLHLNGQELAVTALATRPEVAEMATLGLPQLVQALAGQGLVLTQFQVRLQDQPGDRLTPAVAGTREKGSEWGGNLSSSSRRRSGEVDRFI
jgi:hypothetical protein